MPTGSEVVSKLRDAWWVFGVIAAVAVGFGFRIATPADALTQIKADTKKVEADALGRDVISDSRISKLEEAVKTIDALAVSQCLETKNPAIRAVLKCSLRLAGQ